MMVNKIEDRVIGMIDAKYGRLEKKIQWLTFQGHSKSKICRMLNVNPGTVERAIERGNKT
jgi:transposase